MDTKQITIIVPLHEYNEAVKPLLKQAVESVDQTKHDVLFVGPKDVIETAGKDNEGVTLIVNEGATDFFSQVNKAAYSCVTPYFSILEYDDIYLPNWETVFQTEDITGCSVVIPINELYKNGEFSRFANEIAWDAAFIEQDGELGVVTEGELKIFQDFYTNGGIIKTEDFISVGAFKPEYMFMGWFEFLMRLVKGGKKLYVVPRVCYRHTIFRDGSYMTTNFGKLMSQDEYTEKIKSIIGEEEEKVEQ